MADVAMVAMRQQRQPHFHGRPSSGVLPLPAMTEGDEEEEEVEDDEGYSTDDEEDNEDVKLEKRLEMLEKVVKSIMKAPLIMDEESVRHVANTWKGHSRSRGSIDSQASDNQESNNNEENSSSSWRQAG